MLFSIGKNDFILEKARKGTYFLLKGQVFLKKTTLTPQMNLFCFFMFPFLFPPFLHLETGLFFSVNTITQL